MFAVSQSLDFYILSTAQGHLRTIKLCHQHTHISKLFDIYIYINPVSSQSTKLIPTQILNKAYLHKHQTQFFEELVPSILPLLKERIRLGHAGIGNHSSFQYQMIKEKHKKGMDRNSNTSVIWQQANNS